MCSKDILNEISKLLHDLISYNIRVMNLKLNYSDEFYINYLNLYYPNKFYADYFCYSDECNNLNTIFFHQKKYYSNLKLKLKFRNKNFNFRMILFNINDNDAINKFFINHINSFLLHSCNSYTKNEHNDKIFHSNINLFDFWFDNNHNIILERSFYNDTFIKLYTYSDNLYIGFINKINDFSNNFDYDHFYNENFDYIKGYSFKDIENMKFKDIDMCCFSKRYIEAYFNNDTKFIPKIYYG